jgi:hypothetical protein
MADAVAVRTVAETRDRIVVHLTNISDGTGEAAAIKVDKSTLVSSLDIEPVSLDIEKVAWCCDGMAVRILWDHTTDDLALALSGSGSVDFTQAGGTSDQKQPTSAFLEDPRSAGATGDILVTTTGHTAGDTYNVTLWLRKRPT